MKDLLARLYVSCSCSRALNGRSTFGLPRPEPSRRAIELRDHDTDITTRWNEQIRSTSQNAASKTCPVRVRGAPIILSVSINVDAAISKRPSPAYPCLSPPHQCREIRGAEEASQRSLTDPNPALSATSSRWTGPSRPPSLGLTLAPARVYRVSWPPVTVDRRRPSPG